jgi:hypothetical protein
MVYGANPDPQNPYKLVKNLATPPTNWLTAQQASRFFSKLLYEFWGFCVNGTDDLQKPGGFANVTFPANFESGSLVLLSSGSTGYTEFGTDEFKCDEISFSSLDQTHNLINCYLVTWKENSTSTDDSIYRILKYTSDNSIKVDIFNGGTTRYSGDVSFSERSNINFRIVDFNYVSKTLPGWGNHQLVFNLSGSSSVNEDQEISQFRVAWLSNQANIAVDLSPSGSWTGTTFTDILLPVTQSWFNAGSEGSGMFYLFGGKDFLICHLRGNGTSWDSVTKKPVLHIEIPKRLYQKDVDPNPITMMMALNGSVASTRISPVTGTYQNGFLMCSQDGATRNWNTLVKTITSTGDHTHFSIVPSNQGVLNGISKFNSLSYSNVHRNEVSSSYIIISDAVLAQTGSIANDQYSLARAKLRRVKFTSSNVPLMARVGERWIHVGGGILWPWDGTKMSFNLFSGGAPAEPGSDEG